MPSRARAPARTVSGSHFPPKGSVYVEAPGVRSRGPPPGAAEIGQEGGHRREKRRSRSPHQLQAGARARTPPPLTRGFTVLLAASAADPPMDVEQPVACTKKGAKGKGNTLPLRRGFTSLLAAAEAKPWPPAASAALPVPTAKKRQGQGFFFGSRLTHLALSCGRRRHLLTPNQD